MQLYVLFLSDNMMMNLDPANIVDHVALIN